MCLEKFEYSAARRKKFGEQSAVAKAIASKLVEKGK